jgi:dTDP-4-dehydrorhamnose 3,5-epimerase
MALEIRVTDHRVMKITVQRLPIQDVKLVRAGRISDARGYFAETYVRDDFAAAGIDYAFIQDNESTSKAAGTVRGLHFQVPPFAQTKLVRVLRGRILDVVVDLRRSSPSYGRHLAIELDEAAGDQLLVPAGFAHGFCTLEPDTTVFYKVDSVYSAAHDRGVYWADPALAVAWPVTAAEAVVSEKDRELPRLDDLPVYFE